MVTEASRARPNARQSWISLVERGLRARGVLWVLRSWTTEDTLAVQQHCLHTGLFIVLWYRVFRSGKWMHMKSVLV